MVNQELEEQIVQCRKALNNSMTEFKTLVEMLEKENLKDIAKYLDRYTTDYISRFGNDILTDVDSKIEESKK